MPSLGKFSAWIQVEGKHLPEFSIDVDDGESIVTCWVPSEAGKEFSVYWKDSDLEYTLRGNVYVDGQFCGGMASQYPKLRGAVTSNIGSVITGPSTSRALVFSEIDLTDDDQYLQPSSHVENLGEIKITLIETVVTGTGTHSDQSKAIPDKMKLHERSKKGMGHRVGLGKESQRSSSTSLICKDIRTVGTVVFRYRPLAILQANGIAPIDQSNKRKASTPPEEPSDDEEEKAAAAEMELLKARLSELEKRQKKRIKIEVKTEPLSGFRPPKNLGTIDLTDLD